MKVSTRISFPELDRRIIAFHQGRDGELASKSEIEYFVRNEVEHALEFLASDYHRMSETGKRIPSRSQRKGA